MSPAPMPFEVVRRAPSGAIVTGSAGTSIRRSWGIVAPKLRAPADGLGDRVPYLAVQGDVRLAIGPDVDDRRALGGKRALERGVEAGEVLRRLVGEAVQR